MHEKIATIQCGMTYKKESWIFKKLPKQMLTQTNVLVDMISKIAIESKFLGRTNLNHFKNITHMLNSKFIKKLIVRLSKPTQTPKIDVNGYIRLSSKDEYNLNSVYKQASLIRDFCNDNNYNLTYIVES